MRKLLLTSTALVAASSIANYAAADVAVTGAFEWGYTTQSADLTANDGDSFRQDNEVTVTFTSKTDSGLSLTGRWYVDADDGVAAPSGESSLAISGGFGKIMIMALIIILITSFSILPLLISFFPEIKEGKTFKFSILTNFFDIATNFGKSECLYKLELCDLLIFCKILVLFFSMIFIYKSIWCDFFTTLIKQNVIIIQILVDIHTKD